MSNTAHPDDAASFSEAESSEEELDHAMSDGDCEVCRELRLPDPISIETTYAELRRTAAHGCELCEVLQRISETACTGADRMIRDTDDVYVGPALDRGVGCAARLSVTRGIGDTFQKYTVNFHVASDDSCPWPFINSENGPDENACIRDCAQPISRMLEACNSEHSTTCKADCLRQSSMGLQPRQFIPKRLLYIGSVDTLLLYETANCETALKEVDLRYTALSHCWGSTPIVKTTTVTIPEFETKGICWASLPRTFQEAILLTRDLGINYIWIDSLCILQDSVHDWADQASQMARIFSNAYLTIAASASENGHQGLLNRRRTTRKLDVVHKDKAFAVHVRDVISHGFRKSCDTPFVNFEYLPLRKRAWCFQEDVLSTRIAHFTDREITFVCRAATTCECDRSWQSRFQIPPIIGTSSAHPSTIWNNIIEHYTGRGISFSKDRLPALSSLAQFFEEESGRYLAGLWESHLPGSLLWWTASGYRPGTYCESKSRPPSWSWAAIEGEVFCCEFPLVQDVAQVLDVCTYPCTVDPRGMVSGGQITLRAPLFPLDGIWDKDFESPWQTILENFCWRISSPSWFACSPGWAFELQWSEENYCACVLDDPTDPLLLLPNRVIDTPIFLLVVRTMDDSDPYEGVPYPGGCGFLGLLLKPLQDLDEIQTKTMEDSESKLSFMRIGFGGMCLSKEDGEDALNRFKDTVVTIF